MKVIRSIKLKQGSYEEILPDFSSDFPYIASYVELDHHLGRRSPWHWHKEIEMFYMEEGELEYNTPQGKQFFSAGSGGIINSNVLHMTKTRDEVGPVRAFLHIFDPVFISGRMGNTIDRKYVMPLVTASGTEIIGLHPGDPAQEKLLDILRRSFALSEEEDGYELHLRAVLSEIWCGLLPMVKPPEGKEDRTKQMSEKIKTMMVFIHEHFSDKLTVSEIAASAYISERECFRAFKECLNTTPVEYTTSCRIQKACHLLAETRESITSICQTCGMGSSSYFGKLFREHIGCSPMEYRNRRRNSDT